jgi:hypothetical protein
MLEHWPFAHWSAGISTWPPPQEAQPDIPQDASQEEEPFEIELVVPESPTAQGSPAEEQQQPKEQDVEDEAYEEYPPPCDTKDEKMD